MNRLPLLASCALMLVAVASPRQVPAAAAAPAAPAAPVNLDFELGELGQMPAGWQMTAASERAGFGADLTDEQPYQGKTCAVVRGIGYSRTPGTATLMQSFDAAAYRGQRVRFRAAVRTDDSRGQLWLAVERPGQLPGFFDNMADRPIASSRWQVYEILGEVAADATRIGIGLTVNGDGRVWIDAGAFEVLGPAADAPPRPLSARGLTNLIAFARLLGYARYFHPSDQSAAADWGSFTAAAVADLDPAAPATAPSDGDSLAAALQRLFAPLAPTLRVFATGHRPPALDLGPPAGAAPAELRVVSWRHAGLAAAGGASLFSSLRFRDEPGGPGKPAVADLDPRVPFTADLGGGASCLLPLAVWADAAGTLPRSPGSAASGTPVQGGTAAGGAAAVPAATTPVAAPVSPADRSSRLAIVILAWNVLQHFDPSLAAGGVARAIAWRKALPAALEEAAAGTGAESLVDTLRRMVAVTDDGQATIVAAADRRTHGLPPT